MFLLSYIFIAVVVIYIGLAVYLYKLAIKHYPHKKSVSKLVVAFFILLPTYDIIITNTLGAYHCLTTPSTYIGQKVEYPQSIYWEDNVYPGFNAEDRKLMIMNYLDGVHLKIMALNGDDGKVYVYEAKEGEFDSFQYDEKYKDRYTQYASIIMKNEKVYTKETMPKMNYTVTFDEVKLNPLSRMFLYSDEMNIVDNSTKKVVAKNQRVMKLLYNITPRLRQIYYIPEPVCGDSYFYFDRNIFKYFGHHGSAKHKIDLDKHLYNKYIKGEK